MAEEPRPELVCKSGGSRRKQGRDSGGEARERAEGGDQKDQGGRGRCACEGARAPSTGPERGCGDGSERCRGGRVE